MDFLIYSFSFHADINFRKCCSNTRFGFLKFARTFSSRFYMKLYRCWIMWRQPLVMVIPCILSLAFLGANLTKINWFSELTLHHSHRVIFFFSVSWSQEQRSSSISIIFQWLWHSSSYHWAWTHLSLLSLYTESSPYTTTFGDSKVTFKKNGQHDLNSLISILIESGLITFVAQLAQSIMYKYADAVFLLVSGIVVML